MNNTARVDFLAKSVANNTQATAKFPYSSVANLDFKAKFNSQLQTFNNQVENFPKQPQPPLTKPDTAQASGESLPTSEESRNFIAGVPEDEQQELMEGVSQELADLLPEESQGFLAGLSEDEQQELMESVSRWLADMSPEDLQQLKKDFEDDPEAVIAGMPTELQTLLADLKNTEGFSEFLAGLLGADIDFQRLAVLARGDYLSLVAKDLTVKADDSSAAFDNKLNIKQQTAELTAVVKDKVGDLVSSLNSLSAANALGAVRAGSDTLNQLLQSAGMGLAGTPAANAVPPAGARVAAGLSAIPFMMQAAAESNAQSLANRISLMNAKNMQVAEMRLDPPKLGSVRVQIRMQGDQTSVVFQAANPHARELLEQSLPKLREMMEAQGLILADAQVSEESFSGQSQERDTSGKSGQYAGSGTEGDEEGSDEMQIPLLTQPLGLIDYYA